jgi:hypothetical protein
MARSCALPVCASECVPWVRPSADPAAPVVADGLKPAGWLLWRSWPLKRSPLDRDRMIDHS